LREGVGRRERETGPKITGRDACATDIRFKKQIIDFENGDIA
jgi:hypothetical protein